MKKRTLVCYDPDEQCKQAIIFARVSTQDQYDKGASIPAQINRMTNYCNDRGLKIIKTYDIPESSTVGKRKIFHEMVEFIKSQKHKIAITVYCIDRLQRGYKEYVELDTLREMGRIELHFFKEGLILTKDSNSADISRWDFGILGAKMYVGNLRDNVIRSQKFKLKQGQWLNFAPVGYLNTKAPDGSADIIVDPIRGPMVQKLFREYASGLHSCETLSNLAKKMGLTSARRNCTKTLCRVQIHEMLTNPFYIGIMATNKRKKYNNEKVNIKYYPHRYPPLINKELFDRVQLILNERNQNSNTSKAWYGEKDFVLRGLIRCSHCGGLMTSERHINRSGKVYTYLKCNHIDKTCPQKPIPEHEIMEQIEDKIFNSLHITPTLMENIKNCIKESLLEDNKINAANKRAISVQIQQLEERKRKLLSTWLDGRIDDSSYNDVLTEINERLDELRKTTSSFEKYDKNLDEVLEKISDIALNAKKMFNCSIISKKHEILKLILSNTRIEGKNLYFSINKPFDKLLFSKGCNTWYLWPDLNQHALTGNRF